MEQRPYSEAGPSPYSYAQGGSDVLLCHRPTRSRDVTENPVYVSVQVFAFPDAATAQDAHKYLGGGDVRWRLTIWSARDGGGLAPCPDKVHRSLRWRYSRRVHRSLTAAPTYRADLTNDGSIGPWLAAAARRAAFSTGPQNHHGV